MKGMDFFVSIFVMFLGAMLIATVLMFVVSTVVLTRRAYRIAKGTWRMSAPTQAAYKRWAKYLTDARWVGHLVVVVAATLAGYKQQWQAIVVLLVGWGFLGMVLRMTAGLLLQWAGSPLPPSWWSRLRRSGGPAERNRRA